MDDFIAGWVGGFTSLLVSHPVDTLKVRQQTFNTSGMTAIRTTLEYEGFRGFYKGMLFPLLMWGPSNSIFFGVNGYCMKKLEHVSHVDHRSENFNNVYIAGCIAGFVQTLFYSPVEYIKILLQTRTGSKSTGHWTKHYQAPYHTPIEAFVGVVKSRGITGLYKGLMPMLLRDVPTSGIYTLSYELIRFKYLKDYHVPELAKEVVAGGTAGILSIVTVFPIDVVKTRIQTDDPFNPEYRGFFDCIKKLYIREGYEIFFKGSIPTGLRAFPTHATMFVTYELVKNLLQKSGYFT